MSANRLTAYSGLVNTFGSALKTILQLSAPTNIHLLIEEISISFQGIVSTDPPALVQVMYQSSAGTGGSAVTIKKHNQLYSETIQSTSLSGPAAPATAWTGEPTAGDIIRSIQVHPQGRHQWIMPFGRELDIKGGGRIAIVVTEPGATAHICTAEFIYRE